MKTKYIKKDKIDIFKSYLFDNFSYKMVALFISLILWISILNRRDFIMLKDFDVDLMVAPNLVVASQSVATIKVRVSGAQPTLKTFKQSSSLVAFDLTDKTAGYYDIEVNPAKIEVPNGIKVIGIRPNTIRVEIIEKPSN